MSFKDYAGLQEEIRSFLWDRGDVAARIPSFIDLAEAEMRRLLKTRQATCRKAFTTSGGGVSLPCGADQVQAVRVGHRDLDYIAPERFDSVNPEYENDCGRFYTVYDCRVKFHAPEGRDGEIIYLGPFSPLSETCRTNWILERHPDIYLSGALKWAKMWLIDADQDWGSPFYAAIREANRVNPRVQSNTKLRADDATIMASRHKFDIRTGGIS